MRCLTPAMATRERLYHWRPRSLQTRQLLAASLALIAFLALAGYALDRALLNTAETILREAARLPADLIIMATHGHGAVFDLLVGSISQAVLRASPVPVLMVPARNSTAT